MDLREVGCDPADWIDLAEDRDQWRAYVRAVINLGFFKRQLVRELIKFLIIRNNKNIIIIIIIIIFEPGSLLPSLQKLGIGPYLQQELSNL